MTIEYRLKPCPFCGSNKLEMVPAKIYPTFFIECLGCGACSGGNYKTEKRTAEMWNTRR